MLIIGKISGTLYDHFGDVEGFTLEAYNGRTTSSTAEKRRSSRSSRWHGSTAAS